MFSDDEKSLLMTGKGDSLTEEKRSSRIVILQNFTDFFPGCVL
jgi:hypothetical protein